MEQSHPPNFLLERLTTLYQRLPALVISNVVMMGMAYLLLKDSVPSKTLYTALLLSTAISVSLLIYDRIFNSPDLKDKNLQNDKSYIAKWRLSYIIGFGFLGLIWGSFAILFIEPIRGNFFDLSQQFYPVVIYFSAIFVVSSLAIALGILPSAFISFTLCAMFPYLGILLLHPAPHYLWMGYAAILYLVAVFYLAHLTYQRIVNTLTLQHKNNILQDDLKAESLALIEASKDKSRFLATASHDLRQPLHTSILLLGILQQELTTERQKYRLKNLKQAIEAQTELLSSLLSVSRLDAGIIKANKAHLPLNEILTEMRNEFRPEAAAQGRELIIDYSELVVLSDKVLLERILRNLLTNAFRHTQSFPIEVGVQQKSDHIEILVKDSGSKISKQAASHILSKFNLEGCTEENHHKSSGLGLSIVKRLCDLLEHPISLELIPNVSTCFTIQVPYGEAEKVAFASTDHVIDYNQMIAGHHIMVIDDEKGTVDAMRSVIKQWSCDLSYAYSVKEALALINNGKTPDLIISDYLFPDELTGLDCIQAIRLALGKDIPALIITGNTEPKILQAIKAHQLHFLNKPVNLAQLRVAVTQLLKTA